MTVVFGDAREEVALLRPRSIQTFVSDIPYNQGEDYGLVPDNLPEAEYFDMIQDVLRSAKSAIALDGSFFLIHYPVYVARILPLAEAVGWRYHQWLTWVYPTNIGHSKKRWTTASRAILWLNGGPNPKFRPERVLQPYRNPTDRRVKALIESGRKGTHLYDWWEIDLCKNVSSQHKGYSNQIPEELLRRLILCTTDEGDVVGDPFAGTFSTIRTAVKLGRRGWGCDMNRETERFVEDVLRA